MTKLSTPQPARHAAPIVKAQRLAYLLFERPDLDKAATFLTDFGLQIAQRTDAEMYLRASGPHPFCYVIRKAPEARFVGLGFEVETLQDLERLSRESGASAITASPHLGGGQMVSLRDPSGFTVEVLHGQQRVDALPHREPLVWNVNEQHTRINDTQRPPMSPPEVLRLGHVVLEVAQYQATCAWYTRTLGMIPSDVQVLPDGEPIVTFMRLDLGDTPADHHTLAIGQGLMPSYSHSAYEMVDTDAIGVGQKLLRDKGWKHAWGIGRHILGSQIFDYWSDPWGDKHEHYCDGDLFTADRPMEVHEVSPQAMSQWGQRMPKSFTKPKLSFRLIKGLIHSLRTSPDLTVRKLITLSKLFS